MIQEMLVVAYIFTLPFSTKHFSPYLDLCCLQSFQCVLNRNLYIWENFV